MIKLKDLIREDVYEYFYHATTADALPSIQSKGLLPSEESHWGGELGELSYGKVFVTKNFNTAVFYGNSGIWKSQDPNRFKPVLRFKYNKLRFVPDKQSANDFYVKYPLKVVFEVFVSQDKNDTDDRGDVHYNQNKGEWRILTKDIAESIKYGEWDGEIIDDEI
jgi:hypothetical protein